MMVVILAGLLRRYHLIAALGLGLVHSPVGANEQALIIVIGLQLGHPQADGGAGGLSPCQAEAPLLKIDAQSFRYIPRLLQGASRQDHRELLPAVTAGHVIVSNV